MKSKVFITGATGLLGREVVQAFQFAGYEVVGTGLSRINPPSTIKLDILDHGEIRRVLNEVKPSVVVHCAANRFPDSCQAHPSAAIALNVESSRKLAIEASKHSIFLIYISTDYVFSGKPGEAPYASDAATDPPNVYGQTKRDGEVAVLEALEGSDMPGVVLRVPLLYGHAEKDDPSKSAVHPIVEAIWKAQSIKEGDPKIKMDHYGERYPTATEDVGRVCVDIVKLYTKDTTRNLPKILQFSSEDKYTKYEMCKLIAEEILGLPIDSIEAYDPTRDEKEQKSATVRPYDTHLDTSGLKNLGIDVSTINFLAWWRRELRSFRH
ncbi:putative methionine adenosyltransferase 2 subunit beta [Tothia fuscella]|uniref:Methionine adenosyltransferase 2 subunit beta n=1 Tax=Tothia fuscella TaxID=1048955 RepID=A0A9P4P5E2_9PEZI|nr:putative methionine adenosyltransferase 2 subunit beta [Tothia fuscella]